MGKLSLENLEMPRVSTGDFFTLSRGAYVKPDSLSISYTSVGQSELMSFDLSGSVAKIGLGTNSPAYELDILGEVQITEDLYVNGELYVPSVVPGLIIMWSGVTFPDGWILCDGTLGTPNLVDRFVIGADGDSFMDGDYPVGNFNGSTSSRTGSDDGAHTHSGTLTSSGGSSHTSSSNVAGSTGSHTHTVALSSTGAHSHTATLGGTTLAATTTMPSHRHQAAAGDFSVLNSSASGSTTFDTNTYWETVAMIANGSTQSHNHIFTLANVLNHTHSGTTPSQTVNQAHAHTATANTAGAHTHTVSLASDGAHNHTISDIRPPYYSLVYLMKL